MILTEKEHEAIGLKAMTVADIMYLFNGSKCVAWSSLVHDRRYDGATRWHAFSFEYENQKCYQPLT